LSEHHFYTSKIPVTAGKAACFHFEWLVPILTFLMHLAVSLPHRIEQSMRRYLSIAERFVHVAEGVLPQGGLFPLGEH
jgi:hypothetical protein